MRPLNIKFLIALILVFPTIFCNSQASSLLERHSLKNSSKALLSENFPNKVIPPLHHLGVSWHLGNEYQDSFQQVTQEFFPQGQGPSNWEEKLTIHYWDHLTKNQLLAYPKELCKHLKNEYKSQVYTRIIQKDSKSIFFEWELIKSKETQQHEWLRIFNQGSYTLGFRYCTKKLHKVEKIREYWEKILLELKADSTPVHSNTKNPELAPPLDPFLLINFHNDKLHYHYLIPKNWKISLSRQNGKKQSLHTNVKKTVSFLVTPIEKESNSFIEYVKDRELTYKRNKKYGTVNKSFSKLEDPSGKKEIFLMRFEPKVLQNGVSIQYLIAWVQEENKLCKITFSCVNKYFKDFEPSFLEITQSLSQNAQHKAAVSPKTVIQ
ncbi:hypothetical protein AB751O23_AK_00220 [Chlamydiales bacterium SCGC AB-751-O23]|jgi:hypothetical protein|nr:hypothetical protein AB751O23_AK_00220 [Chlamydiales bacterium SCGC AB-751-O23]